MKCAEGDLTVWGTPDRVCQGQRSSDGIHIIFTRESLLRFSVKSCKLRCGIKSQSTHTDCRAFCRAAVHSGRSRLRAHHPTPRACIPFSQRPATPALSVPGLPFSSDPTHTKVLGTYPKSKGPGHLKLPQHGYSSAPEILSRMFPEERSTPLKYHSRHLSAHSGSS